MPLEEKQPLPKNQLLGEILINRHIITSEQLKKALEVQKKEDKYLGELLVKLGFAEELDIVAALVVQCNLPYIAIQKYEIDQSILQLVPKETAWKYQIIPLDRVGDVLSVVMEDPLDIAVKAELHRMTNCKIVPFICTQSDIQMALEHFYGKEK